ncbi:hypothetical protein NDU88_004400 [Pleurodeles waltl]|uniref:Uncharacterized protein n=1 Tax=Pleurodeles waltl TaxID=8319 RepID=A0AAV7UF68_PLEWA|nr:hypothetical protein NDU88_004400 [Pleurodeles waltl]
MDAVYLGLGLLKTDHHKLVDGVEDAEYAMTALGPSVHELQAKLDTMKDEVTAFYRLVEDAKGHSRQNNIRFLGFPERDKLPSTELFLEEWLMATILDKVPMLFLEERHTMSRGTHTLLRHCLTRSLQASLIFMTETLYYNATT